MNREPDMSIYKKEYDCPHCSKVCKGLMAYYAHIDYYHTPNKPITRGGRATRPPLASELLGALESTHGNISQAAKKLGVSYPYFTKWGEVLIPEELRRYRESKEKLLFLPIYNHSTSAAYKLAARVLSGEAPPPKTWNMRPQVKMRNLIRWGLIPGVCSICGFSEQRVTDGTSPFLLDFIDSNRNNWLEENLRVMCYNCFYLNVHDAWGMSKNNLKSL